MADVPGFLREAAGRDAAAAGGRFLGMLQDAIGESAQARGG